MQAPVFSSESYIDGGNNPAHNKGTSGSAVRGTQETIAPGSIRKSTSGARCLLWPLFWKIDCICPDEPWGEILNLCDICWWFSEIS